MDNGKLSTYIISGATIIFAAILAQPGLIEPLLGDYYTRFVAIVPLLIVIYNAYYPRKQEPIEADSA